MKLYKYKSLIPFEHTSEIIQTRQFYLSDWKNLNDPMEGFFYQIVSEDSEIETNQIVKDFIKFKSQLKVCSFSKTMSSLLLWTYYANSNKGVAFEIEIREKHEKLVKVDYIKRIQLIDFTTVSNPVIVLSKKISLWAYEKEYRYIGIDDHVTIGEITAIYLGSRISAENRKKIKDFNYYNIPIIETELDFSKNKVVLRNN